MIARWKIRRELGRLGQQMRGLTDRFTDPIVQRSLDRTVAAGLPNTNAAMAIGRKVALYLVYQLKGIAASTLATCRRLSQAGYTPLIVSNAPINLGLFRRVLQSRLLLDRSWDNLKAYPR